MCTKCDFLKTLETVEKSNPAIKDGMRTEAGYYDNKDASILERFFPGLPKGFVKKIADCFNGPRLQEVTGVVMLAHRWITGNDSKVKGLPENMRVCSNPLSILFWHHGRPKRLITDETEKLHKPMEKTALRNHTMQKINAYLNQSLGIQLAFGCSCCAFVTATDSLPIFFESPYYGTREKLGRVFDSDVQSPKGDLMYAKSVADLPESILEASADFGQEEVASYLLLDKALKACVVENPVNVDEKIAQACSEAESFLLQ